ncbi:Uncharacterized protein T03_8274 [Trichinella britovi]|uniref:Integrase catalytic domain-containing protein n=1 Tax=Trichinella britovi TaxID=45882 RepID=A0A0V1CLZ1_TRIBR|nr:Uncharacterized protein T03_8274 [Trichinella britovi]
MKTITHFEEFDTSNPAGWEEYSERLVFFLEANSIREGPRRLAVLCSVCGPKTYSIIKSLTSPDPPSAKTFDEVMKLLRNHFMPRPSEVYQRFLYHRRLQQPGEGVAAYVAELRHLAQHCNFGETLESRLRDQLVRGLRDGILQKQLLADGELTFAKALERALSAEAATTQVSDIRAANPTVTTEVQLVAHKNSDCNSSMRNVHRQQESPQPQSHKPCYRCGGAHAQNTCRFKNVSCNFCKRLGHIERVCRAKSQSTVKKGAAKPNRINHLTAPNEVITTLPFPDVRVSLNNVVIPMQVDSEASLTIISEHTFKRVCLPHQRHLEPFHSVLRDFQGREVDVLGVSSLPIKFSSFTESLPVVVVKGPRRSLLGRNWFKPLGIRLVGVHSVAPTSVQDLIDEYAELFSDTLGTVKGPPVVLHTDESIPPIQMNARRVPFALKDRITEEIESFVKACAECQETRHEPAKNVMDAWPEATEPWTRIHADFFGPIGGKIFLLVVDAFSKWLEVRIVPSTSSVAAIEAFRELFATHGLPDCLVTDNGTAFKSAEFLAFMQSN